MYSNDVKMKTLESAFVEHAPSIHRRVLRIVGSVEHADDVVQEVFAKTLREIRNGMDIKSLGAWLNTCSRNAAISMVRERQAKAPVSLAEDITETANNSIHDEVESKQRSTTVIKALSQMPERQSMAFLLTEVKGLSYGKAANELDTTANGIRQLLFRARSELRQRLGTEMASIAAPALRQFFHIQTNRTSPLTHIHRWLTNHILEIYFRIRASSGVGHEKIAAKLASLAASAVMIGGAIGGITTVGSIVINELPSYGRGGDQVSGSDSDMQRLHPRFYPIRTSTATINTPISDSSYELFPLYGPSTDAVWQIKARSLLGEATELTSALLAKDSFLPKEFGSFGYLPSPCTYCNPSKDTPIFRFGKQSEQQDTDSLMKSNDSLRNGSGGRERSLKHYRVTYRRQSSDKRTYKTSDRQIKRERRPRVITRDDGDDNPKNTDYQLTNTTPDDTFVPAMQPGDIGRPAPGNDGGPSFNEPGTLAGSNQEKR